MPVEWIASKFKGVRYYKHKTRRHGVMSDKYFAIRYQFEGKRQEEGLGWASEGWTAKKAFLILNDLKEAAKKGKGATRLTEKRRLAEEERKAMILADDLEKAQSIKFSEVFEQYKVSIKSRLKDWTNYESRYKVHIGPAIGDLPLIHITTDRLKAIKAQLQLKGLSPATIRHILGIVRQVFNWATDQNVYNGNSPFAGGEGKKLMPRHLNNARKKILSPEEEAILLPALLEKSPDIHDMAIISLYSGMRWAEIAKLRWQDINFSQKTIDVLGKGDKERTVPMCATVLSIFTARQLSHSMPSSLIFPSSVERIRPQISKSFADTIKQLGLNDGIDDRRHKITFHTLRHTFATRLAEAGTPLTILRDLLGHRDLIMVSRYAKSSLQQAAERVEALDLGT